jgi:hypothetical protein
MLFWISARIREATIRRGLFIPNYMDFLLKMSTA